MEKNISSVLPLLNALNLNDSKVLESDEKFTVNSSAKKTLPFKQFAPLGFRIRDNSDNYSNIWYLPFEPLISIAGVNEIQRRNVSKSKEATSVDSFNSSLVEKGKIELKGSIKERIRPTDFDITVTGILINEIESEFPRGDFERLQKFLKSEYDLYVYSPLLEMYGIYKVVVSEWSFPFTKGENNQAFEFKAWSDFDYNLEL